jgi:hypothetical protein
MKDTEDAFTIIIPTLFEIANMGSIGIVDNFDSQKLKSKRN